MAWVALDWGTSSLRAWLLDEAGQVLDRRASPLGIRKVPGNDFAGVFRDTVKDWPAGLPALACGMIGSRNGWLEAPYAATPAGGEEIAVALVRVPDAPHVASLHFVPGVRTHDALGHPDVMRGEETQLLGLHQDGLAVLPGTHSKWARLENGRITGFSTWMTGECYALLRGQSILGALATDPPAPDWAAFDEGCRRTLGRGDVLHALFGARARVLEGGMPGTCVPDYLSGLLLGEELRGAREAGWLRPGETPVLLGEPALVARYARALGLLQVSTLPAPADPALPGLLRIARAAGLIKNGAPA